MGFKVSTRLVAGVSRRDRSGPCAALSFGSQGCQFTVTEPTPLEGTVAVNGTVFDVAPEFAVSWTM